MPTKRYTIKWKSGLLSPDFQSHSFGRAIASAMFWLFDEKTVINALEKATLSNLTPSFISNGKWIHTLPMPFIPFTGNIDFTRIKKYKKVNFIAENLVENLDSNAKGFLEGKDDLIIKAGILLSKKDEPKKLEMARENVMHNVRRRGIEAEDPSTLEFFAHPETFYTGMSFSIIVSGEETSLNAIESGLKLLSERGYGKRISVGGGQFTIANKENMNLPTPNPEKKSILLSSWLPNEKITPISYQLGYFRPFNTHNPGTRQTQQGIRYIKAGALVKNTGNTIVGKNITLKGNGSKSIFLGKALVYGGLNT